MATDVDDAGAVALLHALADQGEAEILAMGVSVANDHSALALDAINTFFRRPHIPIGTTKAGDAYRPAKARVRYAAQLAKEYPRSRQHWQGAADAPDVVSVYRAVLGAQPDISPDSPGVVIVSVGMLTNLRDLLHSQPDAHSDLAGRDLLRRKVRLWVGMAGHFPSGREYNLHTHQAASDDVLNHWPTPALFSGYEIGKEITTGPELQALPAGRGPDGHIIRRAYQLHRSLQRGRPSWDQATVLYAVRGLDGGPASRYWQLSAAGRVQLAADGANSWRDNPKGPQRYKIEHKRPAAIAKEINRLMLSGNTVISASQSQRQ
ncbi:MAG: hypothetical protein ACRC1L_15515 [Prochlorococcaceae cyanobacterium]